MKKIIKLLLRLLPDKWAIQIDYFKRFKKFANLKNPQTLNEKLQWLKLYNRKPEYTTMVDKYAVKEYVADIIGEEYIIPTLGVWDRFEDIDFDALPNQFVLKTTHDSGGVVICKDKSQLDKDAAKRKIEKSLSTNYYWSGREWPYKNVPPKIIAEQYITDSPDVDVITDYKFYCFGENVDSVLVCVERETGTPKFYFFDQDWNLRRYNKRGKEAPEGFTLPKPHKMDEMFQVALKLAQSCNVPFLRIDLYNSNGQILFGELTFFPSSGFDANRLPETDLYFGSLTNLDQIRKRKK